MGQTLFIIIKRLKLPVKGKYTLPVERKKCHRWKKNAKCTWTFFYRWNFSIPRGSVYLPWEKNVLIFLIEWLIKAFSLVLFPPKKCVHSHYELIYLVQVNNPILNKFFWKKFFFFQSKFEYLIEFCAMMTR